MTYLEASGNGWRLINGDCLDVMSTLDRVDVICTDPPYEAEAHTKARRSLKDATQKKGARNTGAVRRIDAPLALDFAAITAEDRATAAQHWARLARRWVVAFCQVEGIAPWRSSLENARRAARGRALHGAIACPRVAMPCAAASTPRWWTRAPTGASAPKPRRMPPPSRSTCALASGRPNDLPDLRGEVRPRGRDRRPEGRAGAAWWGCDTCDQTGRLGAPLRRVAMILPKETE